MGVHLVYIVLTVFVLNVNIFFLLKFWEIYFVLNLFLINNFLHIYQIIMSSNYSDAL
jgi:hypothetical protein